jgi:hypothetical protein
MELLVILNIKELHNIGRLEDFWKVNNYTKL